MVDLKSVCDIIDMQKGTYKYVSGKKKKKKNKKKQTKMFLGIVVVKTTYKLCESWRR